MSVDEMDGQEGVVELKSWNCKLGKWKKVGGLLIKILVWRIINESVVGEDLKSRILAK